MYAEAQIGVRTLSTLLLWMDGYAILHEQRAWRFSLRAEYYFDLSKGRFAMEGITVLHTEMSYSKEDGYVGKVQFGVEGHSNQYEIALQSKRGNDWGYGLFFLHESGNEEQLNELEERLEEDDELFDFLIDSAKSSLAE